MIKGDIQELDKAGLRKFGIITGIFVSLVFGLFLPWLFSFSTPNWPFIVSAILVLWAFLLPLTIRPVYRGWMRVGMVLGFINTHIILFLLYYVIFFPVALIFKIIGHDPMARKLIKAPDHSYRVMSIKRDHKHFERPY